MSRNFTLTVGAADDAVVIWEFVASDESPMTDKVVARIYNECEKLGAMPGMGHFREDLMDRNYKFWKVWSYLIVYRWQAIPIEVIALVHGARNLNSFLRHRS